MSPRANAPLGGGNVIAVDGIPCTVLDALADVMGVPRVRMPTAHERLLAALFDAQERVAQEGVAVGGGVVTLPWGTYTRNADGSVTFEGDEVERARFERAFAKARKL